MMTRAARWRGVGVRVLREASSDRISLVAAGCAFYATLALFPALSMFISLYGLVFDPHSVEPQLHVLSGLLPPSAFQLISERVQELISRPARTLGLGLAFSAAFALWSAAAGTKSMLSAMNMAYDAPEQRGFVRFQLTAFAITLLTIIGAILGLALLLGLPAVFAFVGLSSSAKGLIQVASFGLLLLFVLVAVSVLYRFGPSRPPGPWRWVTPGSVFATLLWLIVSLLFSIYVGRFASYDATYGPIGAVVAVMMWFYVTVYVVLVGAELNADLEGQGDAARQAGVDMPGGGRRPADVPGPQAAGSSGR